MENKLIVSSSPHIRSNRTTQKIMLDVIISLVPCIVAGAVIFGVRALAVVAFCTGACVLLEYLCRLVMKREQTVTDLSAAVTGILLGLTLPPTINLFLAFAGCVVAIVIVKQMFGGIGNNFVNPALTGRIVMLLSFPTQMTTWTLADGTTCATPLGGTTAGYKELFFGTTGGCIGETCAIAILLGLAYLLVRRVIKPIIPLCYLGTAALLSLILGQNVLFQLLSGELLFGAVFMATDYTTSPVTDKGKIIFAVGCGILTVLIRLYASLPEGVSYAIVLMNIMVPLIERVTVPKTFGIVKEAKKS
ncbi:MAG TPA: RnfABCDGE type electron transport complex subunit D [Bacillota bacterium]|nr:RnfABCDGE type electron transport complex subunit D [Bacillota bacterium]